MPIEQGQLSVASLNNGSRIYHYKVPPQTRFIKTILCMGHSLISLPIDHGSVEEGGRSKQIVEG
mgnify:CR=1 FL=1